MLVATSNKSNQLLVLSYVGHIRLEELARQRENIKALAVELSPGFRILADFTHLKVMDSDCTTEIGSMMEVLDRIGVGMVVRVLPDPSKDVGLNILSHFHYRHHPQVVTCDNFSDGIRALGL